MNIDVTTPIDPIRSRLARWARFGLGSLLVGLVAVPCWGAGPASLGHWTFEEGTGTTTADRSGNNLDGTLDNVATWGGPAWVASPFGQHALSFDGVNDRVNLGNPTALRLTGPMTVSAWVYVRRFNTSGRIVTKGGGGGSRGWALTVEVGNGTTTPFQAAGIQIAANGNTLYAVNTTTGIASNQWIHLCGVYEPGVALRFYTNGFLNNERTDSVPAAQHNTGLNVTIGGRPTGSVDNPFNGVIDEVRVFDRALTQAEIQALPELVQTPLTFKTQPLSRTVAETRPVTFTAAVSGSPPYSVQWYENGVEIPGAADFSISIPSVMPWMNGNRYHVEVKNLAYTATSDTAVLTVSADTTSPTVVGVGSADGNAVGVCFSEPMDQNLLWDPSYFTVNGGAVGVAWSMPRADGQSAMLYLTAPITGAFSVAVTGVTDLVGNPIAAGPPANGTVVGMTAADLGFPAQLGETFTCRPEVFEITAGGVDLWGAADHGHFASSQVSGDFDVKVQVLSLTPVHNTAKAGLMVRATRDADSPTVHLLANPPLPTGRGYIEAGRRASAGGATAVWGTTFTGAAMPDVWLRLRRWGDQFAAFRSTDGVDWTAMGQTTLTLADPVHLGLAATAHSDTTDPTLAKFGAYGNVVFSGVTLAIAQPPTDTSVVQNTSASFQVQVEATGAPASELAYQWQRDDGTGAFVDLANATGPTYSLVARPVDHGARFRVQVYFAGLIENSAVATLTLIPDVTPPTLVSVSAAGNPTALTVIFSEDMDPTSATTVGRYQLTGPGGGVVLSAAALGVDARTVLLSTDAPLTEGPVYTLSIENVVDQAVPANVISPNPTRATFAYSSLAGHWPFEEGSGTSTADASGNGFTGALQNGPPTWAPGLFGQHALSFDGINSRVNVGNPDTLRITGPMTLSAWVWVRTVAANGRIVTKGGGGGQRGWSLNVENSDVFAFQVATNPNALVSVASIGPVPRERWTHVAGVYDPNDVGGPILKLYVDGVLDATLTSGVLETQSNSGQSVGIGNRAGGGTPFDGLIDEVRIYTRALSDAEIAELAEPPAAAPQFLAPVLAGNQLTLNWTGTAQLQWAPTVTGPWSDFTPAPTPPHTIEVVPGENRFFRLWTTP